MTSATLVMFFHILAAMLWVGGMLFISLVVVPATRGWEQSMRTAVLQEIGQRFRVVGWTALVVLIGTGFVNAARFGMTVQSLMAGDWLLSQFGRLLLVKVGLVVVMIILAVGHEVLTTASIGTQRDVAKDGASQPNMDEGAGADRRTRRAISSWLARINLIVALLVVLVAVMLVHTLT